MKEAWTILLLMQIAGFCSGFTGDDKFLKKYAMMKVYESCFGQDVVKEVRMEMKAAASKCAGISPSAPASLHVPPLKVAPHLPQHFHGQQQPLAAHHHQASAQNKVSHLESQNSESNQPPGSIRDSGVEAGTSSLQVAEPLTHHKQPTLDLERLQQAIMAGYNKQSSGSHHTHHQHLGGQQSLMGQQQGYLHQPSLRPYHHQQQQYQSPSLNSIYYPGYQQPLPQPQPLYAAPPQPYAFPPAASPYQPMYQPLGPPAPMQYPVSPYYHGRSSRDLDVRGQLETLSNSMAGRIRNVTCVMQELGYLDGNLDPDYSRMIDRIGRLPVSEDLKKDMAEGVEFCRQFSQCVPDDRKDKLIQEMVRPMFFFRCYKHKKLEACIMKDVRERYNNNADELTEDNLASDNRAAKEFPEDNMATAIYEFLYGGDNIDLDTLV